ncbi:thioredoxin family protein [candidate division TA06 bacterium]|nr:thioredoxin family protein [candidate division TA06 bacterium]
MALKIGERAPDFDLPGVDGNRYSLKSFEGKKAMVVIFTCNHCPYVQAYEDRIIAIHKDYEGKGATIAAINSNETKNYPEDSFEKMVERSKKKGFNFPYLRDEDQSVATTYGATHTPQIFLFDENRTLRYTGRIDDNWKEPEKVTTQDLREALEAVLEGKTVANPETFTIGCTIKWMK